VGDLLREEKSGELVPELCTDRGCSPRLTS
jgi:hypothetical protein